MSDLRIFGVACLLMISAMGVAWAQGFQVSEEYPGKQTIGDGTIDMASNQIHVGAMAYRRVFGSFPETWQQVVDSGLYDQELIGFQMQELDPDNSEIVNHGEHLYSAGIGADGVAFFEIESLKLDGSGIHSQLSRDEMLGTYDETLQFMLDQGNLSPAQSAFTLAWKTSISQKIQFGQLSILNSSLLVYRDIHGSYPPDISTLIDAGLGPFTHDSINPLTGERYRFDGSIGDILYELTEDGHFRLSHVWTDGPLDFGFSY